MYADTRYQPRKPRAASLGAAFLINGAIIAGMIYSAPDFVKKVLDRPIETYAVPEVLPPPPIEEPKPQPEAKTKPATEPPITAPKSLVQTDSNLELKTSTVIPEFPPQPLPLDPGPPTRAEPRVEPAALFVSARRDSRYADDFQPDYPALELRAQRDGRVSVKVLVGTDGRVKAVEQLSATSAAFFEATKRQALSRWRFKPATRGGAAEESWLTLTVTFRIQDQ